MAIVIVGVVSMLLSCAEVVQPPGGEIDKTGPYILSSIPANNSLRVSPGSRIELLFSEVLLEPTSGRSIFLSPRPPVYPKVRFKSDRIVIELAEPFRQDQTYVVTMSSSVTDLRRNKIDSLASIAFSTGAQIDSGSVSGAVLQEGTAPVGGSPGTSSLVGLFDLDRINDSTILDSIYPDYLTSTASDGSFRLSYLPERAYQLIAFTDRNRDERFNPASEPYALPDRQILVGGEVDLGAIVMRLTHDDTSAVSILSASYTSDHLVRLRLSREIDIHRFRPLLAQARLISQADSTAIFGANGLLESDLESASQINLFFGVVPEGRYSVHLTIDSTTAPISYESLNISDSEDKNNPTIVRYLPGEKPVVFKDLELGLVMSEPVDQSRVTPESVVLWGNDDQQVSLTAQWTDPFHLSLITDEVLSGGSYRLTVSQFDLVDPAGNLMGDSLTDLPFTILDRDSLGSVSGQLLKPDWVDPEAAVVVKLSELKHQQDFSVVAEESGAFHLDLPAGKYLMWGFIDRDRNGEITDGSISPLSLSETIFTRPDTVHVRARFETTGLELPIR